ncbi:MAG: Uracil phosphoribosyltransferase (EC / Pyrimidine operon regulatory protein PyrR [uncultured Thiotrichaceae bacterium]|uniref:Uracil phosphoribosyltransferase n=1 Tax=uncultured Thiotrichaceae bacterium TaxID=298394 RepID=A0A6S6U1J1_9GAMM|nr:MAG: Uracil phosphoribosyltransferase (EC / Pyrimidine operon regulatory protein PyrR [uncultured Thiotrichaceae bacterium]
MTDQSMNIPAALAAMVDDIRALMAEKNIETPLIVGIHTGGVWIANALRERLGISESLGELNINFYRDDFTRNGLHPQIQPSKLPLSIEDRHILLVDDVLFTGRTVRAAMNEIFDYGRPASITLAVLFEREGRELPVFAEVSGIKQTLGKKQYIDISGPEPLELTIRNKA